VNPSLYLSDVVAMTSDVIAMASMSQDTVTSWSVERLRRLHSSAWQK
jgi:hypothetical protein